MRSLFCHHLLRENKKNIIYMSNGTELSHSRSLKMFYESSNKVFDIDDFVRVACPGSIAPFPLLRYMRWHFNRQLDVCAVRTPSLILFFWFQGKDHLFFTFWSARIQITNHFLCPDNDPFASRSPTTNTGLALATSTCIHNKTKQTFPQTSAHSGYELVHPW